VNNNKWAMAENIDFDEIDTHNDFVEETKQGFD
jgi:hypothetical protein